MNPAPINIAGIPIPSDQPIFLAILAVHVAAGLTAVATGLLAMASHKAPGRHPWAGVWYYRSLATVFVTMAALSAMRWAEDYHLFIIGAVAMTAAVLGRRNAPPRPNAQPRVHVTGMGTSYILLLTAFYVDNGPNLPVWRHLPALAYWVLPGAVGGPLIWHVLRTHPLLQGRNNRSWRR